MAWTESCLYALKVYQSLMLDISGRFHAIFVCRGIRRRASVKTGKTMADTINIGKAIHDELLRQGRTVAWLSRQLGTSRMACYRIFNSYSVDTQMLLRISDMLGRDFFALYSDALKH